MIIATITGLLLYLISPWLVLIPALSAVCLIAFFRNPPRHIPDVPRAFLAPADGVVTEIEEVEEPDLSPGKVLRIGIFLSVLNVHINRSPMAGKVSKVLYRPGKYLNAMKSRSAKENESNLIVFTTNDGMNYGIRQISGAIARRIVCDVTEGDNCSSGEMVGMIKFGSRTDLFVPIENKVNVHVSVGQKVAAGTTILGELA